MTKNNNENERLENELRSINTDLGKLKLEEKSDQIIISGLNLKEALHKELIDKFKVKHTDKNQIVCSANLPFEEDNFAEESDNKDEKLFKIVQEDEDSKSISSIEGSLKGISSMDQNSIGLNSSTPLIYMYPNIEGNFYFVYSQMKTYKYHLLIINICKLVLN